MRTKLLASSMLVAAMFTACQSESDEAVVDSSEMVEVSFGMGGEFTAEDGVLTRATTTFDYYYVAVSASAASNGNISSGYVGYFTSLTGVSLSLPKGTYNVYISAYKQDGYTIDWSSVNSSLTAGSFKEVSAATATAPDFADQKVDRYYGSTSQAINTNATVTVNGKRFAYGVNVDIEKPLEGKVVLSSTSPAFSYTATTAAVTASNIYSLAGTDASTASKSMDVTMTLYDASNAVVATQTKTITIARNHMKTLKVKALDPKASFDFSAEDEDMTDDGEEQFGSGHDYVDLGITVDGKTIYWATCNVGANSPEEYGDYFAWGETVPYYADGHSTDNPCSNWRTIVGRTITGYNIASYKHCDGTSTGLTKYCTESYYGNVDNKKVLDSEDDAATANWGGTWRIPTQEELNLLIQQCTWTWTTQNNVNGYKIQGTNGNYIFLPAAGCRSSSDLSAVGSYVYYWANKINLATPWQARCIEFSSSVDSQSTSNGNRQFGYTVRPICQ